MADITVFPNSRSTTARFGTAWSSLAPRRRGLVLGGVAGAVGIALAAARQVPIASAVAVGAVGVLAAVAAVVDVHEHRIPNRLLMAALTIVALAAALAGWRTVADVLVGLVIGSVPLFVVRYDKGLGLGDIKFAAVLGAAGGLVHPGVGLVAVWAAALASGLFALRTDRMRLALAPWLWAGFVAACAAGLVMVQLGGTSWPARF
jgi:leader peptidase (prepilin peptidase) / N-methyltransferase